MTSRCFIACAALGSVLLQGSSAPEAGASVDQASSQFRPGPPLGQAIPVPGPGHSPEPIDVLVVEPLRASAPVQGAPYSADVVAEFVQEFVDGNRIERISTSKVARDARGRVRREQQLMSIGRLVPVGDVRIVTIDDPVAGAHYSLDPMHKTALRSRPRTGDVDRPLPSPDAEGYSMRTENLGTKQLDGLIANGSRTMMSIPSGEIGNIRPIEIVSERWHSPTLRVTLMSVRRDPRVGQVTYRLANVVTAEPPPQLFQVPADYEVRDMRSPEFVPAPVRPHR